MSDFQDEAVFQIWGRLGAHEALLVELYAQYLVQTESQQIDAFVSRFEKAMRVQTVSEFAHPGAEPDTALLIAQDAQAMSVLFFQKVRKRIDALRAA